MIEVYDGTNSLCMYVSPKTVTKMTTKEMEQLIRRLGQAMELYND